MAKQFDYVRGNDKIAVAKSTVGGGLGGSIGVRVIVDDAVLTSKEQALMGLTVIEQRLLEDTWPLA